MRRRPRDLALVSWRAPLAVAALALIARAAFLAGGAHDPFVSLRTVDEVSHLELAHRFAAGDLFFGREALWFPPAYPVFLGVIEKSFGSIERIVPPLQHACGVVSAVLVTLTGGRLGSAGAGTIAGGLLALLPTLVHAESRIHYTALLVLASAAFLFVLAGTLRSPARGGAGLAGLWLGIAGLFRANVLAFAPFAAVDLARRFGAGAAARFAVGALVTLVPITLRNGILAGSWTPLTSNGGMILATAFASDSAGGRALERTPQDFGPGGAFQREAEQEVGRALTLAEASRWHGARTIERVLASPGWALGLTGRKLRILASAEEIDDHPGFTIARERTRALGWLPVPWAWVALPGRGRCGSRASRTRRHGARVSIAARVSRDLGRDASRVLRDQPLSASAPRPGVADRRPRRGADRPCGSWARFSRGRQRCSLSSASRRSRCCGIPESVPTPR